MLIVATGQTEAEEAHEARAIVASARERIVGVGA